jgi:hypothetical protein
MVYWKFFRQLMFMISFTPQPKFIVALLASALCCSASTQAQSGFVNDDGSPQIAASPGNGGSGTTLGTGCTPTSLTTHFNAGNGSGGNMFDITPNFNMYLRCMDVHTSSAAGNTVSVELWYKLGTCENNQTNNGQWTQVLNTTAISAGSGNPTRVDLSTVDVIFEAGIEYGIYMALTSTRYTNGPSGSTSTDFSNADLTLTTYYGIASGWGNSFSPREWNGTLYYEPAKPSLTVHNLVAGGLTTFELGNMTPGNGAYFVLSTVGFGTSVTPYATFDLASPLIVAPPPPLPLLVDASGQVSLSTMVPVSAVNRSLFMQGIEITPSDRRLSDAIEAVVQ